MVSVNMIPLLNLDLVLGGSDSKESAFDAGDLGSIAGSGRSPGEGNGNPLQYYCLENPMDRGGWEATAHRVTKSQTWLKQLSMLQFMGSQIVGHDLETRQYG